MSSSSSRSRSRSWKEINQKVPPAAMSRLGRRRVMFSGVRLGVGAALLMGMAWGGYELYALWRDNPGFFRPSLSSVPIREVTVTTNGVLPREWVLDRLSIPEGASLMDLDLARLQSAVMRHGQVRTAVLHRRFPDVLEISIEERSPVARIAARGENGAVRVYCVARDGAVYSPVGYSTMHAASFPWLDGIRLVRDGEGFGSLGGMDAVAGLIAAARTQAPHLYRDWTVIDCAHLEPLGEMAVRTRDGRQYIFSSRMEYLRQLARLDYILDFARQQSVPLPPRVDLSLGSQVPVMFENTPLNAQDMNPQSSRRAL